MKPGRQTASITAKNVASGVDIGLIVDPYCGEDWPVSGNASRTAHEAGISPEVIAARPGIMVLEFIGGRTLTEQAAPVEIVFGHNDLPAANFTDDGRRLWLIDYDYRAFNSPLFDRGGLAANNSLNPGQETRMLEEYLEEEMREQRWIFHQGMKCALLLRESIWSMASEIHSGLDCDCRAYPEENLIRYEAALNQFMTLNRA